MKSDARNLAINGVGHMLLQKCCLRWPRLLTRVSFKQDPGMSLTLRYQLLAVVDVGGQPVH